MAERRLVLAPPVNVMTAMARATMDCISAELSLIELPFTPSGLAKGRKSGSQRADADALRPAKHGEFLL